MNVLSSVITLRIVLSVGKDNFPGANTAVHSIVFRITESQNHRITEW